MLEQKIKMVKRIRTAQETEKYLNQDDNWSNYMSGYLLYLRDNLQTIEVNSAKGSYQYLSCGQRHDPRNPNFRPFQHLQKFAQMNRCDFGTAKAFLNFHILTRIECECELLTNSKEVRRKDLERSFGLHFGGSGRKEFDLL